MMARMNIVFTWFWRLIVWTWHILIIEVVVGFAVNLFYTYLTTGSVNFADPRTLTIFSFLRSFFVQFILLLVSFIVLTFCAYVANRQQHALSQKPESKPGKTPIPPGRTTHQEIPALWNIPQPRNPFFTGREHLLALLHEKLTATRVVGLTSTQAINGLGGTGKTQIAIEYAYRYQKEYQHVLWFNATTRQTLISDFVKLANLLCLPEKDQQDQNITVAATRCWLANNAGWLLIVDNAEDLEMASEFLPAGDAGHLLLTTRAQATGTIANSLEVTSMEQEEGTLFLLRRAKLLAADAALYLAPQEDRAQAGAIVRAMEGLPLALDQAGAFIEETGCSIPEYLELFRTRRKKLLKRRGRLTLPKDHPASVTTTFSLSFQKVKQSNRAAADLLRLCAFLDSDTIPEELFNRSTLALSFGLWRLATDSLKLKEAIEVLRRFSFIRHNPSMKTITTHRLLQAVLIDDMRKHTQRLWAKRAVQVINRIFPSVEAATWPQCQRYLPQAQASAALINKYRLVFPEAARLLNQTASYLQDHAHYAQAEPLYLHALTIYEKALGPHHLDTATCLDNLAGLYLAQGHYEKAGLFLKRALAIREKRLGPRHSDTATSLNDLAQVYDAQGKCEEAESLLQRALAIHENVQGPDHPSTAICLGNLARLYRDQGQYEKAEPLLQRVLAIHKRVLGSEHPNTAISLNNLAGLYHAQGQYEKAEPLYQLALEINEKALEPEHPYIATSLNNLAVFYRDQGQYEQARLCYQRTLAIYEKALGPEHPYIAASLNNLALLYSDQGQFEQAKSLYLQALNINEKALGPEHPNTIKMRKNYLDLLKKMI